MKDSKAAELERTADQLIKPNCIGVSENNLDEASELYTKAANLYKSNKNYENAISCLNKSVEIQLHDLKNLREAALQYVELSKCYRMINRKDSVIEALKQAATLYEEEGRLSNAAKHYKEIGEYYETDQAFQLAIPHYERSSQLFHAEGTEFSASESLGKAAFCYAQMQDWKKAAETFEEAASLASSKTLSQYTFFGYLLSAGICVLVYDEVAMEQKLEKWCQTYSSFDRTNEYRFLHSVTDATMRQDLKTFFQIISENEVLLREPWKVSALLAVKKRINEESESMN